MSSGVASGSQGVARRVVKIKTKDYPHLEFNGKDVRNFVKRYESAGEIEGAGGYDLAIQNLSFLRGKEILEMVEEMEGYEKRDWDLMKRQMLAVWDKEVSAPRYTLKDLEGLVCKWEKKGGVESRLDYQLFAVEFDQVTGYLLKNKHIRHEEFIVEPFFKALSPSIQQELKKKLIIDNKMEESLDHTLILPQLSVVRSYVDKEMEYRRLLSFQEKNEKLLEANNQKMKKQLEEKKPQPVQRSTSPNNLEKKVEELTKQLEAFKQQIGSSQRPKPAQQQQQGRMVRKCWYCHEEGHTSMYCRAVDEDMKEGLVKREGVKVLFQDGTPLPLDFNKPQREAVKARKVVSNASTVKPEKTVESKCGILHWEPPVVASTSYQEFEVDLGKRGRKPAAQSDSRKDSRLETSRPRTRSDRVEVEEEYESDEMVEDRAQGDLLLGSQRERRVVESRSNEDLTLGSHGKGKQQAERSDRPQRRVTVLDPTDADMEIVDGDGEGMEMLELTKKEKEWLLKSRARRLKAQEEGPKPKAEYYCPATKNHPRAVEKLLEKIFDETTVPVKLGELAAVAPHVAEGLKKWSTRKKVQILGEEGEEERREGHQTTVVKFVDITDKGELRNTLYSCPLSFVSVDIQGQHVKPLVDSGSQINLLSLKFASDWGIGFRQHKASLGGIGGHSTELVGIAEDVSVKVAGIVSKTHFFVADGPVQTVLGRPYLFGREAKLLYVDCKGEMLALKDEGGEYIMVPLCSVQKNNWYDRVPDYYKAKMGTVCRSIGGISGHEHGCAEPPRSQYLIRSDQDHHQIYGLE